MSTRDPRRRGVNSSDVAKHAGVSRAAVSRAFTPDASVSPQTRQKVHQAAKELGYRVNYLARSLINQRSDLVGVVVAGMNNPFRTQQIDQIARALLRRNFSPVLLPVDESQGSTHIIERLLHYSVSGMVVTSDAPPTALCQECAARGVPIVLINKGDEIPFVDRVISDHTTAGQLAAKTLIEGGGRHPAVMGAAAVSYTARQRQTAFITECRRRGIRAVVVAVPADDYQSGYDAAPRLEANIDGLFCINDYMACGMIDRLRQEAGRRLPDDIRLVGHDDIQQAAWANYQLTTIRQPHDIQAEQALDLLTSRMARADLPARVEYTPVSLARRRTA